MIKTLIIKKTKFKNTTIAVLSLLFLILFNSQANAGAILHRFKIQLPNGEEVNMTGGPSMHSVVRDNNNIGHFDYCDYDRNGDNEHSKRLKAYPEYQCYTPSGCDWSTWHAPYFPASFDSTVKEYSVNEVLKNGSGEKDENIGGSNASYANFDPEGKSFTQRFPWAKTYFNAQDPLGGASFYWEGRVDAICPADPSDDSNCINRGPQAFKILTVQKPSQTPGLDYDLRNSGENAVADVQSQIDPLWRNVLWRKLNSDGTIAGGEGLNNRQAGYDSKPVTYNTKTGEKSILYNAVGGNAIHGNVTWVLKNSIPKPASVPVCDGFNIYKEDNTLLTSAAGSINLSTDTTTKFKIATATFDKEESLVGKKIDICWTLAGQPEAFYRRGLESITCESGISILGSRPGVGKVETKAKTFQEYVDFLLVDAKNPMTGKIAADVKNLINEQVAQNGLVFFASYYDSTNLYCTSNVGWNGGKGAIIEIGSITNRNSDPNNCAVASSGRTCTATVKVQAVVPTCGDSKCDAGEKCDGINICVSGGAFSSGACRADCTYCGDAVVQSGEECDPKDPVTGPNCEATCKRKVVVQSTCGDNLCNVTGETCDGTTACVGTGLAQSFVCRAAGTVAECTYCGDNIVNGGEECDDGNTNNNDGCNTSCLKPNKCDDVCTAELGCAGGLTCVSNKCTGQICEEPPECGDTKCDTGESCDGNIKCIGNGELSANECRTGGTNECTFCGDGIVQTATGEQCDDSNINNSDSCDNNCKLPAVARCGDGVCDSGEKCEGSISCTTNQSLKSGQVCRLDCTYCGDNTVQAGEQCDDGAETASCTSSCVRKIVTTPTPAISAVVTTPIPTLEGTALEADEIWMYTIGMTLIGLGLIAYRLNLGYKFAGIVMDGGGFEILLKLKHVKKAMQRKGLLRRSRKEFEKDFMEEDE